MGSPDSDPGNYCPKCGALLAPGVVQCWKCQGESLDSPAAPADQAAESDGAPFQQESDPNPYAAPRAPTAPDVSLGKTAIRVLKITVLVVVVGMGAMVAFFATCAAVVMGSGRIDSNSNGTVAAAIILGGLAAVAAVIGLVWLFRSRRR